MPVSIAVTDWDQALRIINTARAQIRRDRPGAFAAIEDDEMDDGIEELTASVEMDGWDAYNAACRARSEREELARKPQAFGLSAKAIYSERLRARTARVKASVLPFAFDEEHDDEDEEQPASLDASSIYAARAEARKQRKK